MTTRSRKWRRALTLLLLVGLFVACTGIREDELACEDAVSYLQECCPGFSASNVDCTYAQGECDVGTVYPEISISQSACVRGESCAELRSTGVCARAIAVPAGTTWSNEETNAPLDDASPSSPRVCP
jgi:hypothetical protein